MSIGASMQESIAKRDGIDNPIGELSAIVEQMNVDLKWYREKYPNANTSKKAELIQKLESIKDTLLLLEPLGVWRELWRKLDEARLQNEDRDVALVYFPLKSSLPPDWADVKQIVIDLCGYNFPDPMDYDYCRSKFYTSHPKNELE